MPWLEKNFPFIATIITDLIIFVAMSLIELKYALWLLPLFGISFILGVNVWVVSASLLLAFAISLGSDHMQEIVGPQYPAIKNALIISMASLSLLQIVVYVLNRKADRAKGVRKTIARNTVFAISGISFLYIAIYLLFRGFPLLSEINIPFS